MEDEDIFTQMPAIEGSLVGSNNNLVVTPNADIDTDIAGNGIINYGKAFPKTLLTPPDLPTLNNPSAADRFLPFLLDEESYLKKYGTPALSDKEIDDLYKDSNFKDERLLALSQFGFGLLNPTVGGKIGASLASAAQGLTQNLSQIKAAQKKEQKSNQQAKVSLKMQQEAQSLLDRKSVFDSNRALMTDIAGKEYEAEIAADKASMEFYRKSLESHQKTFDDYKLDATKPKKTQIRVPNANGELGDPRDAYTVQEILEDGGLSAPQYYLPSNEIGPDGLPVMKLLENPEGVIEVKTSITDTSEGAGIGTASVAGFLDLKGNLDQKDRGIVLLDQILETFQGSEVRAGFFAGIKAKLQTYEAVVGELFSDILNEDEAVTLNDGRVIPKGQKYFGFDTYINTFLNDPQVKADIASGKISKQEADGLKKSQLIFDQLGIEGRAQQEAEFAKAWDAKDYSQQNELFESQEEKSKIRSFLGFDRKLPANEARANAIIYAIARSRKDTGRLNLDDIQRAADDLNIYGGSKQDVIAKIGVIRDNLLASRDRTYETIRIIYKPFYEELEALDYKDYDRDRVTRLVEQTSTGVRTPVLSEEIIQKLNQGFTIGENGLQ